MSASRLNSRSQFPCRSDGETDCSHFEVSGTTGLEAGFTFVGLVGVIDPRALEWRPLLKGPCSRHPGGNADRRTDSDGGRQRLELRLKGDTLFQILRIVEQDAQLDAPVAGLWEVGRAGISRIEIGSGIFRGKQH